MHKEDIKEKGIFNSDICEWSGNSKDFLTRHIQQKHIEQLKRKIVKEQPTKCYICGFQSSSETAFKIHTEEKHDQTYCIQRETSVTKSPPTKRVKEHHVEYMDTDPLDIVKQKDKEIMDFKCTINKLKEKLQNAENCITKVQKPIEYTFKCETCNKQFTQRSNLLYHMKEHTTPKELVIIEDKSTHDKTRNRSKVHFSEIHNCGKCVEVFQNKPLLEEHDTKYHKETPIASVGANIPCGCLYPCIPVATARRVDKQQETQVGEHTLKTQEGSREQPEAWQHVGKSGRPKCPICGKTRNTVSAMEKHLKDHDEDLDDNLDDSLFNCRNCDFQSQTRIHLVEHLKIKHGLHTCSSCNVTCASKIELETHIKEHMKHKQSDVQTDPENQYSCRSCDQICSNKESLNRHIIEDHQSHKPCREFATNSCAYERDFRYKPIILKKMRTYLLQIWINIYFKIIPIGSHKERPS